MLASVDGWFTASLQEYQAIIMLNCKTAGVADDNTHW
jgi:hypothetical protein